jgi:hypothetical protein
MTTKTNKTSKIGPIGKKLFFLMLFLFIHQVLFPNRVGSEAVINSQPNFFDEWICNYRQQDNCDGRLGHHILAVRAESRFVFGLWLSVFDAQRNHVPLSQQSLSVKLFKDASLGWENNFND